MSETNPFVIETSRETFEKDVIERSSSVPVLVDFWAAWCGPCRMLGPVLEKLAGEYAGRFVLVKADTERMPEVASSFAVRSIPAVFAVRDGTIVDSFVGVLGESAIRSFIDAVMPTDAETLAAVARRLEASDPGAAAAKYRESLALAPDDPRTKIGLARSELAAGKKEEARAIIDGLAKRGYLEPDAEAVRAQLTLGEHAGGVGATERARAAAEAAPGDLGRKLALAEALAAAGEYAEALDLCLDLVERDRRGTGESARKTMLAIFQVLPPDSELVSEYRRRLSLVL